MVREQLGRPLEAHDIYYQNLAPEASSEELDRRVRERFGTIVGLKQKLPEVLLELGYTPDDANFLADNIRVEICKGAGHAVPPGRPEYSSWMRTSSLADELGWDGFDTAMHELGHNIEQVVSCHFAPRPILRGVPNTACTEAFAFLYQSQARRVLGLPDMDDPHLATVQRLIEACEIAGPALLEIRVWRWLYEHPETDAATLHEEVLRLAGALWSEFYEPYFGPDRYRLLAAYQHMIAYPLYLADYALGYMINHQITAHMAGKDLASETKRICAIGRVTPDLWMRRAVGSPISAEALLDAVAADRSRTEGRLSLPRVPSQLVFIASAIGVVHRHPDNIEVVLARFMVGLRVLRAQPVVQLLRIRADQIRDGVHVDSGEVGHKGFSDARDLQQV